MKSHIFILLLLSLFLATLSQYNALIPGGWTPIKNLKDPHVIEIAKFAVLEHNKEAKTHLELVRVLKGQTQVVAGVNYRIFIFAKDTFDIVRHFEVVVWEKEWEKFRKLISFIELKN